MKTRTEVKVIAAATPSKPSPRKTEDVRKLFVDLVVGP